MFLDVVQTGLIWYYFNIIAMAFIIYMLLKIALARAEKATFNQSESKTRSDNIIIGTAVFVGVFGLVFFFARQYSSDFMKFCEWSYNGIRGLFK